MQLDRVGSVALLAMMPMLLTVSIISMCLPAWPMSLIVHGWFGLLGMRRWLWRVQIGNGWLD